MRRRVLVMSAIGFLLLGAVAVGSRVQTAPQGTNEGAAFVRVDKAMLFQSGGAELYQNLCESCHGTVEFGNRGAVEIRDAMAPPLDQLRKRGVAREHWTYVILAPYEDEHHRDSQGNETMPCWNRLFRQAMGSEAGPLLVSAKLTDYLDENQK